MLGAGLAPNITPDGRYKRKETDHCCGVFSSFKDRQYNMRKLTELPTALIGAERWQLFVESICCIPFVEVSASSSAFS